MTSLQSREITPMYDLHLMPKSEATALARRGTAAFCAQFPMAVKGQSWQIAAGGLASSSACLLRTMVTIVEAEQTEGLGALVRVLVERVVVGQYLLHGDEHSYDALLRASHLSNRRSARDLSLPAPAWAWDGAPPANSESLNFKTLLDRAESAMQQYGCRGGPWLREVAGALYPFESSAGVHTNIEEIMGAFLVATEPPEPNQAVILNGRNEDFAAVRLLNAVALCCTLVQCVVEHAGAEAPAIDAFVEEFVEVSNRYKNPAT